MHLQQGTVRSRHYPAGLRLCGLPCRTGALPQERPLQLKVKGSTEETVPLDYAALPATALLPAESAGQLTVQLELPDTLEAR